MRAVLSVEIDHPLHGCLSSRYVWAVVLDPDISAKIVRYQPKAPPPAWEGIAPLVRSVVAATVTQVPYDVDRLLHVMTSLALWAEDNGLERQPDMWLRNETIDTFVLSLIGKMKPSSVRTYRTWLLRIRDALAWSERGEATPARLKATPQPHQPYTAVELAGLRHWAWHLREQQRRDALALMALGAGYGLTPKEVAATCGSHLRRAGREGPLLHTGVDRDVTLAARAAWEEVAAGLAEEAGGGYLFRPGRSSQYAKNLISSWTGGHRPIGLPPLSAGRLRATWIVDLMKSRIDHDLIAKAAGLGSAASLARYQHFVPDLDQATGVRLLRGSAG